MSLLDQLLSSHWCMLPELANGYLPVIANILSGNNLPISEQKELIESRNIQLQIHSAVPTEVGSFFRGFDNTINIDRVGVVKMSGVMIKEDSLSTFGTDRVYDLLKQAGQNDSIVSTVLMVNSGGGFTDSAENVFNLVNNYKDQYGKPIVAVVDGSGASAAYWAISGADRIILTGNSVMVGSIGTYGSIRDFSEQLKMLGVKEIVVKASKSVNKESEIDQAIEGNTEPYQTNILNKLQKAFETAVLKGRNKEKTKISSDSEVLKGGRYYGKDALKMGLADDILNKEDALDLAFRIGMAAKRKRA